MNWRSLTSLGALHGVCGIHGVVHSVSSCMITNQMQNSYPTPIVVPQRKKEGNSLERLIIITPPCHGAPMLSVPEHWKH